MHLIPVNKNGYCINKNQYGVYNNEDNSSFFSYHKPPPARNGVSHSYYIIDTLLLQYGLKI